MILTKKLVDILSNKNTLRLERAKLPLFLRHEGIVRVASPPALGPKINGNILIDPSMTSPIQVLTPVPPLCLLEVLPWQAIDDSFIELHIRLPELQIDAFSPAF